MSGFLLALLAGRISHFTSRIYPSLEVMRPINVKPAEEGGGGRVGRAWGGDLTFFKNFKSNSPPTGKSFHSNATKFPHPGLHIALSNIPRLDPRKAQ